MTLQIILTIAFILGAPAIAGLIWYANKSKNLQHPPHKWDA